VARAYIVGFGEVLEKESSRTFFELAAESAWGAVRMGGLDMGSIDGLGLVFAQGSVDPPPIRFMLADQVANYLGIQRLRYMDMAEMGGASFNALIHRAARAIEAGLANAVLVLGGGKSGPRRRGILSGELSSRYYVKTHNVVEFLPTSDYAMIAMRYSYEYGVPDEGRALVAVRERENARLNPGAIFREPITVKDVLESPMVSYPLRLLECVMPIDGFSAFLVVNESLARGSSIVPVRILGYGEAHDPRPLMDRDELLSNVIPHSAREALINAEVDLSDIDLFMLYDAYTIMVLLELEGIGLASEGRGWRFVEDNDFSPNSTHPINVNGGTLNTGQPAYMSGGVILTEALMQLSGLAGERQVKDARVALINAIGGTLNHVTTLVLGVQ